jgi:hypothetical protein
MISRYKSWIFSSREYRLIVEIGSTVQATPASVTGSSDTPTITTPGMSGHQTSGSSGTAAAETSGSSATPTKNAGNARYHSNIFSLALPALAFVLL